VATAPHTRWPVWGRTGLDVAPSPDPRGARDTGPRGRTGVGAAWAVWIPAQQVLATAGPAEVAGGCSRRLERRGWRASRNGGSRSRRTARGGTGCRYRSPKTCRCRSPRAWRSLVRCQCPGHLTVPPYGRCGGCRFLRQRPAGVALLRAAFPAGTNPQVTVPRVRPRGTVLQAWSCGRRRGHGPRGRAAWPGPWVPGTAAGTTGGRRAWRTACRQRGPAR